MDRDINRHLKISLSSTDASSCRVRYNIKPLCWLETKVATNVTGFRELGLISFTSLIELPALRTSYVFFRILSRGFCIDDVQASLPWAFGLEGKEWSAVEKGVCWWPTWLCPRTAEVGCSSGVRLTAGFLSPPSTYCAILLLTLSAPSKLLRSFIPFLGFKICTIHRVFLSFRILPYYVTSLRKASSLVAVGSSLTSAFLHMTLEFISLLILHKSRAESTGSGRSDELPIVGIKFLFLEVLIWYRVVEKLQCHREEKGIVGIYVRHRWH